MRLTMYSDISLRVLMYLAGRRGVRVTTQEISKACGMSANHLTKVVHQLGLLGFIENRQGRGGGVQLKLEPDDIRIGEFLRLMEGEEQLVECFRGGQCAYNTFCGFQNALKAAQGQFYSYLNGYTLRDFVDRPAFKKGITRLVKRVEFKERI